MLHANLLSTRYAFVDVETTGFSPVTCAVVEVACLVIDGGHVAAMFETLINPQQSIPSYVTDIHGITDRDVVTKPRLTEVEPFLEAMCDGAIVVAHNAAFDLGFLPFLRKNRSICSYRLAARVVPEAPNHRNQTLREFFRVSDPILNSRAPHRALADVAVTRHVFFACLRRYLYAGLPDNIASLVAFTRRHPQLCRYELRTPCHPEQCACAECCRSIEGQRLPWSSVTRTVSTATAPKFRFR